MNLGAGREGCNCPMVMEMSNRFRGTKEMFRGKGGEGMDEGSKAVMVLAHLRVTSLV